MVATSRVENVSFGSLEAGNKTSEIALPYKTEGPSDTVPSLYIPTPKSAGVPQKSLVVRHTR